MVSRRAFGNAGQNRGFKEIALAIDALSTSQYARAHVDAPAYLLLKRAQDIRRRQRPHIRSRIHWIAHLERRHTLGKLLLELFCNAIIDNEALGSDARLPIIDDARLDGGGNCAIQVSAGHHDEWVAAAECEHGLLDLFAGQGCDAAACPYTAGEGNSRYTRVRDSLVRTVRTDQ